MTLKRAGWVLLVLALALGAVSATFVVIKVLDPLLSTLTSPAYAVPGSESVHLDQARYLIYEEGPGITPGDVHVSAPDGSTVATHLASGDETLTRGQDSYAGVVSFRVPRSGRYLVTIDATEPNEVIIGHELGDLFLSAIVWVLLGVFAGLCVLGATVLLIVAYTRGRSRGPSFVTPGWYPDPFNPAQSRWWDGYQWTGASYPPS